MTAPRDREAVVLRSGRITPAGTPLSKVVLGLGFAVILVVLPAGPAYAHSVGGPSDSSNYRSALTGITPRVTGVSAKVVDDGQQMELTNSTSAPLVILGYSDEPYLMVEAAGVWQNLRSPSLYLNRSTTAGLVYMPPGTDAHAPPQWQQICRCDEAIWHDHRIHWGQPAPPLAVRASPGRFHLVESWNIEALLGQQTITVSGVLSWVPGPSPEPWFAIASVAGLAVLPIGLLRRWRAPLFGGLLIAVIADVARSVGLVAGRSGPFGAQLHALPYDGVFSLLLWLGILITGRAALKGRIGAAYSAATLAVVLLLTGVIPTLSVLWHSQVITTYPANLQRFLTALALGIGAGLILGAIILIDRLDKLAVAVKRLSVADKISD